MTKLSSSRRCYCFKLLAVIAPRILACSTPTQCWDERWVMSCRRSLRCGTFWNAFTMRNWRCSAQRVSGRKVSLWLPARHCSACRTCRQGWPGALPRSIKLKGSRKPSPRWIRTPRLSRVTNVRHCRTTRVEEVISPCWRFGPKLIWCWPTSGEMATCQPTRSHCDARKWPLRRCLPRLSSVTSGVIRPAMSRSCFSGCEHRNRRKRPEEPSVFA